MLQPPNLGKEHQVKGKLRKHMEPIRRDRNGEAATRTTKPSYYAAMLMARSSALQKHTILWRPWKNGFPTSFAIED